MLSKQYTFARDSWKALSRRENIRYIAERVSEVGGTSLIAFVLGHVSRPLALVLFIGLVVWLEKNDPELDEDLSDDITGRGGAPPIADFINRQFRRSPFPTLKPQSKAEQAEFWRLVGVVRDKLNLEEKAA